MTRRRVGVLISGRGSNLQALLDAARKPDCPFEIVLVLSNKAKVQGLERASAAGVATAVVDHRAFPDREAFEKAMTAALEAAQVPRPRGFAAACARLGVAPEPLLIGGGEDYELLFTTRPAARGAALARRLGVSVTPIGRITARPQRASRRSARGWRHF